MKKGTMMVFSALLMSCFLAVPAEAKSIENSTYRVCKNDIFIDYDQLNCKKIVTKVKDDGSFTAIDLGEWLEEQDIYDISVIEDDENTGYKTMFYEILEMPFTFSRMSVNMMGTPVSFTQRLYLPS